MINPLVEAVVCAVVGAMVVPLVLSAWRSPYEFKEVALASVVSGAMLMIPTIGGPLSFLAFIVILDWRIGSPLFPDIVSAVMVARLLMAPSLAPFNQVT